MKTTGSIQHCCKATSTALVRNCNMYHTKADILCWNVTPKQVSISPEDMNPRGYILLPTPSLPSSPLHHFPPPHSTTSLLPTLPLPSSPLYHFPPPSSPLHHLYQPCTIPLLQSASMGGGRCPQQRLGRVWATHQDVTSQSRGSEEMVTSLTPTTGQMKCCLFWKVWYVFSISASLLHCKQENGCITGISPH